MSATRVPPAVDAVWAEHLRDHTEAIYDELTDGFRKQLRISELVYAAAERFPDHLPSRAAIDAERELLQKDKQGLEIAQGHFVAHVLAGDRTGFHLLHSMSQPTAAAKARLGELERDGCVDLGPIRVDRDGDIGTVTIQNHAFLNSEDDVSTAALEVAVDLVLLDDAIRVGVLRGAPATHRKYLGRRIFGSGINLTHLYHGKISLVEFMLERELGQVSKLYRGHDLAPFEGSALEQPAREAVDRGGRQLRDRRRLPVAARHRLRDRGGGLLLRAARAQGRDHPRLRQSPAAADHRRARGPPGALLQPLVLGRRSRRAAARRPGGAGGRDGCRHPPRGLRGDQRR